MGGGACEGGDESTRVGWGDDEGLDAVGGELVDVMNLGGEVGGVIDAFDDEGVVGGMLGLVGDGFLDEGGCGFGGEGFEDEGDLGRGSGRGGSASLEKAGADKEEPSHWERVRGVWD